MSQNRISLSVTEEQKAAALAAVAQLEASLPGLVSLMPGEARTLLHMGQKTEVFGRGVVDALVQHPQIVPPSLDLAGAQQDIAALDRLRPVLVAVQRLHTLLEDSVALLGHDVMDVALDGYQQLKISGAAHGLEDLRRDLGSRFSRGRRQQPEPPAA